MPPTVSTRNGIEAMWSRCECVRQIWSICDSSASVRSPTPVPASIRISLSTRNEVVRRWRPPIPPEQPSTRSRMRLFLVEHGDRLPVGGHRRAASALDLFCIHPVQDAAWREMLQIHEVDLGQIPVARPISAQRLFPDAQFFLLRGMELRRRAERLVHRNRFVLALHLDAVDFAEYDVLHLAPRRLTDQDADAVML